MERHCPYRSASGKTGIQHREFMNWHLCSLMNRFDRFRGTLEEDMIYNITSFMLADARKSYTPVDNPHRIRLTQNTRVAEVNPQPENFPYYAYDAKPLDVLALRTCDNKLSYQMS